MNEVTELANNVYYLLSGLHSIAISDTNIGHVYQTCNSIYRPQVDSLIDELELLNCEVAYSEEDVDKLLPIITFNGIRVECLISQRDTAMSEQAILDEYNSL